MIGTSKIGVAASRGSGGVSAGLVTDGLLMHLDAGNIDSYPGSGTTWSDLSGNGNDAILHNSPTFNSDNGGNIVFDGADDFCQLANLSLGYSFTISMWAESDNSTNGPHIWFSTPTSESNSIGLGINIAGNTNRVVYYPSSGFTQATSSATIDTVYLLTGVFTSSGFDLYVNGAFQATLSGAKSKIWTDSISSYSLMRLTRVTSIYYQGIVYNALIYDKALSASEVLQNYDAEKSRFGL